MPLGAQDRSSDRMLDGYQEIVVGNQVWSGVIQRHPASSVDPIHPVHQNICISRVHLTLTDICILKNTCGFVATSASWSFRRRYAFYINQQRPRCVQPSWGKCLGRNDRAEIVLWYLIVLRTGVVCGMFQLFHATERCLQGTPRARSMNLQK